MERSAEIMFTVNLNPPSTTSHQRATAAPASSHKCLLLGGELIYIRNAWYLAVRQTKSVSSTVFFTGLGLLRSTLLATPLSSQGPAWNPFSHEWRASVVASTSIQFCSSHSSYLTLEPFCGSWTTRSHRRVHPGLSASSITRARVSIIK